MIQKGFLKIVHLYHDSLYLHLGIKTLILLVKNLFYILESQLKYGKTLFLASTCTKYLCLEL